MPTAQLNKEATQFNQPGRTGYLLKMTTEELVGILPAREAEQLSLFTDTNRPITPKHLGSIEKFLADTSDWAMPAIVLSARPGNIQTNGRNITAEPGALEILDGQHRLQAFSNILHQWAIDAPKDDTGEIEKKLESMKQQELPVVIFEVQSNMEHRQMFAWFARNKPIEPAVREFFDQSDPVGKAAKGVMDLSQTLQENVTWKSKSIPPRGADAAKLLTLNQLKEIATTIRIGIRRTPKPADREQCWDPDTQKELQEQLVEFFDSFLPSCQPNYKVLDNQKELTKNIRGDRTVSYACSPPVMRLMANAWARWRFDRKMEPEALADVIGKLNLRAADPENVLYHDWEIITKDRNSKFVGVRHENWEKATTEILRLAGAQANE